MPFKGDSLGRSIPRYYYGFLWQSFIQIILAPILMLIILTPLCIQMFFSIQTESVDNLICYLVTAIALDWNNLTFSDTFGKFDRWEVFSGRESWVWEDFSANKLNCTSSGEVQLTQALNWLKMEKWGTARKTTTNYCSASAIAQCTRTHLSSGDNYPTQPGSHWVQLCGKSKFKETWWTLGPSLESGWAPSWWWRVCQVQLGCDPHSSCILWTEPHTKVAPIPWPGPGVDISPHAALPRPHPTTGLPPPSHNHHTASITLSHTALYTHFHPLSKTCQATAFCPLFAPTFIAPAASHQM